MMNHDATPSGDASMCARRGRLWVRLHMYAYAFACGTSDQDADTCPIDEAMT